jgi:nucleoside phosphorylase
VKILVTFAVEQEFAPWRRRHPFAAVRQGNQTLYCARISEIDAAVLLTGIGPSVAGAEAMGVLMKAFEQNQGFDFCISSGLAGGLQFEHRTGQVLAARVVQSESLRADLGHDEIESDGKMLWQASECGAKLVEKFFTTSRVVAHAGEKARLGGIADAVEMESFEVLLQAAAWGARGVAIRAVSDSAGEDLPLDFNRLVDERGRLKPLLLLAEIARRPQKLPGLLRLARQTRQAAAALADFLDRYVMALAEWEHEARQEEPVAELSAT